MTARFASPTSVSEALAILAVDRAARPIAGGTDLVVAARQGRKALPESIVAIDRIAELAVARAEPGGLLLGALTTHAWLAAEPDVRSNWTALADAAAIVGSPATRSTGTLGGNVMNASPAAETTGPLAVFDATAILRGQGVGERRVLIADLAIGPGRTSAGPGELLTSVRVPRPVPGTGSAYVRLEYRRAMEIAVVGAAVVVTLSSPDRDATITAARVALTAVAPTIVRAIGAESALLGARADDDAARGAGAAAVASATPIDDVRASADYRRAMLEVVVARTVAAAIARARGETVPIPASRWSPGDVAA
jgi:CO/xanthine dehydrogenase FAD-binding subunit